MWRDQKRLWVAAVNPSRPLKMATWCLGLLVLLLLSAPWHAYWHACYHQIESKKKNERDWKHIFERILSSEVERKKKASIFLKRLMTWTITALYWAAGLLKNFYKLPSCWKHLFRQKEPISNTVNWTINSKTILLKRTSPVSTHLLWAPFFFIIWMNREKGITLFEYKYEKA